MAIKTNYNFKGIEIHEATIKVIRIFGSKKEGWSSLVGVYNTTTEIIPATKAIGAKGEEGYVPSAKVSTREVVYLLDEFNHSTSYVEDERGYTSIYKSLMSKYGGEEI